MFSGIGGKEIKSATMTDRTKVHLTFIKGQSILCPLHCTPPPHHHHHHHYIYIT